MTLPTVSVSPYPQTPHARKIQSDNVLYPKLDSFCKMILIKMY